MNQNRQKSTTFRLLTAVLVLAILIQMLSPVSLAPLTLSADGDKEIGVALYKEGSSELSMANDALNHIVKYREENGKHFYTIQFKTKKMGPLEGTVDELYTLINGKENEVARQDITEGEYNRQYTIELSEKVDLLPVKFGISVMPAKPTADLVFTYDLDAEAPTIKSVEKKTGGLWPTYDYVELALNGDESEVNAYQSKLYEVLVNGKKYKKKNFSNGIAKNRFYISDGKVDFTINGFNTDENTVVVMKAVGYKDVTFIVDKDNSYFIPADKTLLVAKIEEAEAIDQTQYTDESVAVLLEKLAEVKVVFGSVESTQEEVDASVESLNKAIEGLVKLAVKPILTDGKYVIKTVILKENDDSLSMSDALFTEDMDVVVKGDTAVAKVYVAYPVPAFPDQGQNGTLKNVFIEYNGVRYDAISDIETKPLKPMKRTVPLFGLEAGKEVPTQVLTFSDMPKEVFSQEYLKSGAFVNVVMNTNVDYRIQLGEIEGIVVIDKAELEAKIEEAKTIELENYTDETVAVLNEKLAEAEAVLANDEATQEAVNNAVSALDTAIEGLVEIYVPEIVADVIQVKLDGETLAEYNNLNDFGVRWMHVVFKEKVWGLGYYEMGHNQVIRNTHEITADNIASIDLGKGVLGGADMVIPMEGNDIYNPVQVAYDERTEGSIIKRDLTVMTLVVTRK